MGEEAREGSVSDEKPLASATVDSGAEGQGASQLIEELKDLTMKQSSSRDGINVSKHSQHGGRRSKKKKEQQQPSFHSRSNRSRSSYSSRRETVSSDESGAGFPGSMPSFYSGSEATSHDVGEFDC